MAEEARKRKRRRASKKTKQSQNDKKDKKNKKVKKRKSRAKPPAATGIKSPIKKRAKPKAVQTLPASAEGLKLYTPNYKRFPAVVTVQGNKQVNHHAGCGPDRVLVNGSCVRNFTKRDLQILCPKIRPKSSLNLPLKST